MSEDEELVNILEGENVTLTINLGNSTSSFEFSHPSYDSIIFGLRVLDNKNALKQVFQSYWNNYTLANSF